MRMCEKDLVDKIDGLMAQCKTRDAIMLLVHIISEQRHHIDELNDTVSLLEDAVLHGGDARNGTR